MAHVGRRNPIRWIVKTRRREAVDVAIAGGTKVGRHRRRVAHWSKWKAVRYMPTAHDARNALAILRRALGPQTEVAVFRRGVRVTDEQLDRIIDEQNADVE